MTTPPRRRRRRRQCSVIEVSLLICLALLQHLASPFVERGAVVSRRAGLPGTRELRSPHPCLSHATRSDRSRKRGFRSIRVVRCAAAALAHSADSALCEGDELRDFTTPPGMYVNVGGRSAARKDGNARQTSEGQNDQLTSAVAGDIVLSDWLDALPCAAAGGLGDVHAGAEVDLILASSSRGQAAARRSRKASGGIGVDNDARDEDNAPFRFQQLIQRMWAELNRNDQLAYLDAEGQGRVKSALTVLAAYGALREHPFHADVTSPQQAFSEMDFNRDGEVSFDEFVRWYSMSSALQNTEETRRQHQSTAAPSRGGDPSGDSTTTQTAAALSSTMKTPSGTSSKTEGRSTAEHAAPSAGTVPSPGRQPTAVVASRPRPVAEQTSRLMADLEELTLAKRPPDARSANGRSAASAGTAAAPSSAKMPKGTSRVVRQKQDQTTPWKPSVAASASARGRDRTVILAPTATSSWAIEDPSGRRVATDAEMDAFRERWLAGGTFSEGSGVKVEVPTNPRQGCGGGDGSTAEENLEKALELLTFLVNANADADTLIAALASRMIRNPTGRYNLEVIEEQFGPIIRGIVEDRLLLDQLPEPVSAASYLAIRQSRGIKAVLDLDDHHAKLMREYLVHVSKDARAVVVHMADLTCRLRARNEIPESSRQSLALEALQLYVPISNALGLGSSFWELEELGYKTLFPKTYATIGLWHRDVRHQSRDIVVDVKRRMLDALANRRDIAERVHRFRIDGRTKGLVSTFRKMFRQNKRVTDVYDIIGLRIIVEPRCDAGPLAPAPGAARILRPAEKNASFVTLSTTPTASAAGTTKLTTTIAKTGVVGRRQVLPGENDSIVPLSTTTTMTDTTTTTLLTEVANAGQALRDVAPTVVDADAQDKHTTSGNDIMPKRVSIERGGKKNRCKYVEERVDQGEVFKEHAFAVEEQASSVGSVTTVHAELSSGASAVQQDRQASNEVDIENSVGASRKDGSEARRKDIAPRASSDSTGKKRKRANSDLSMYTVKSFPPPYRDPDSRLLHDVYEVLVGLFEEVPGRYKNYVDFPKRNGYRSVHTTVLHPTTLKMELQVRTAQMHREAEEGAAAHSLYKGDLNNPDEASVFRSKMTPPGSPTHAAETQKLLEPAKYPIEGALQGKTSSVDPVTGIQ